MEFPNAINVPKLNQGWSLRSRVNNDKFLTGLFTHNDGLPSSYKNDKIQGHNYIENAFPYLDKLQ